MKKILSNVYLLAALFMIGAAITSCSKSDDTPAPEPKPVGPTTYTMTIKATKGGDAKTRALNLDGNTLTASWSTSENVYVQKGSTWATGSLQPQTNDATATLSGTLEDITISADDNLYLQFPQKGDITYVGQKGTLNDIAANFDWATATVEVKSVSPSGDITPKAATTTFTNQQAIVKFTLTDAWDNPINAKSLKISATGLITSGTTTGDITITPDSPTNVIYAALSGISNTAVTLTAIVGDTKTSTHIYQKEGVTFENGKYYTVNVKFQAPLTFECYAQSATVIVTNASSNLQYNVDGHWITYNTQIELSNQQKKVSFRGTNERISIKCLGDCYVYGNVMSLIDSVSYATIKELTTTDVFKGLFRVDDDNDVNDILSHPSKKLLLPATKLSQGCYAEMFRNCKKLQRAPELPASKLEYQSYCEMFYNCSELNYIKCLATDISADECTQNWVVGVPTGSGKGTFEKAASMISWTTGDNGIPSGWTINP